MKSKQETPPYNRLSHSDTPFHAWKSLCNRSIASRSNPLLLSDLAISSSNSLSRLLILSKSSLNLFLSLSRLPPSPISNLPLNSSQSNPISSAFNDTARLWPACACTAHKSRSNPTTSSELAGSALMRGRAHPTPAHACRPQ